MPDKSDNQTFWEHLDELRAVLIRIVAVTLVCGIGAFCFKEQLFAIVLAPQDGDFITYRLLDKIASMTGSRGEAFAVPLINTGLAQQFLIHMRVAFCAGILCASPYIIYQIFRFVSPALYDDERRHAVRVVASGYIMFAAGILLCYFLIFPLTFRFLGTYQVSAGVANMITLDSYISTLVTLCFAMGMLFEIPLLSWFFARLGLISADLMGRYRRHAIVAILVVAAIITPTSDIFTLFVVSLPIWLLYEASILIVRRTRKQAEQA